MTTTRTIYLKSDFPLVFSVTEIKRNTEDIPILSQWFTGVPGCKIPKVNHNYQSQPEFVANTPKSTLFTLQAGQKDHTPNIHQVKGRKSTRALKVKPGEIRLTSVRFVLVEGAISRYRAYQPFSKITTSTKRLELLEFGQRERATIACQRFWNCFVWSGSRECSAINGEFTKFLIRPPLRIVPRWRATLPILLVSYLVFGVSTKSHFTIISFFFMKDFQNCILWLWSRDHCQITNNDISKSDVK